MSNPTKTRIAKANLKVDKEQSYPYHFKVEIFNPLKSKTKIKVGTDLKKDETVHVILEVTDSQFPNLSRYQRVIITGK